MFPLGKSAPNLWCKCSCLVHDLLLVEVDKDSVAHQNLPGDDRCVDHRRRHAEHQMPRERASGERCGSVVVHEDDISEAALLESADRLREELGDKLAVVLGEDVKALSSHHTWVLGIVLMDEVVCLVLLDHVVSHAVCPEADQDPLVEHLFDFRDSDGVVHVGFGISDQRGLCLLQNVHLFVGDVNAVADHRVRSEQPTLLKAFRDRAAVLFVAMLDVIFAFGKMDVESDVQIFVLLLESIHFFHTLCKCLVTASERSVQTKRGS